MVGGWLVSSYGYHICFLATSCLHTTSVLVRIPLLFLVPWEQPAAGGQGEAQPEPRATRAEESDAAASHFQEPLLSTTDSRPSVNS